MPISKINLTSGITGVLPSANATYSTSRVNAKPIIINGDMSVSQRNTTEASVTSTSYNTCDRMQLVCNTMGTHTITQESLTSGAAYEAGFHNAWRLDVTTADSSPAAGDVLYPRYKIESQDLAMFKKGTSAAEPFTLAFWVKSNKTGNAQVNFYDIDNTRLCSGTYSISSANTWEHKVINIAADTTGAWADDNGEGLRIEWRLDSGSNSTSGATPTAWEAHNAADRDVAGQLQIARSTDNDWAITGIQLEVGTFTSATLPSFQFETFAENLERCQRYYRQLDTNNMPHSVVGSQAGANSMYTVWFPKTMRANPSTSFSGDLTEYYLTSAGASNSSRTITSMNISDNRTDGVRYFFSGAGQSGLISWTDWVGTTAKMTISAEL